MIQIDDAGSGSLIGGTGIGILRPSTQDYYFDLIPLEYFQNPKFTQKKYQDYVVELVKQGFSKLAVEPKEPIQVCRSYIFDKLRDWLTAEGYSWSSTVIEGTLQEKVEESFNEYVISLGLPPNFVKHARYAFGFHRLIKWVFTDLTSREKLCKTGWKSWQKWAHTERSFCLNHALKKEFCLKCGEIIQAGEPVVTLEYETNKLWSINLHKSCYPEPLKKLPIITYIM